MKWLSHDTIPGQHPLLEEDELNSMSLGSIITYETVPYNGDREMVASLYAIVQVTGGWAHGLKFKLPLRNLDVMFAARALTILEKENTATKESVAPTYEGHKLNVRQQKVAVEQLDEPLHKYLKTQDLRQHTLLKWCEAKFNYQLNKILCK